MKGFVNVILIIIAIGILSLLLNGLDSIGLGNNDSLIGFGLGALGLFGLIIVIIKIVNRK